MASYANEPIAEARRFFLIPAVAIVLMPLVVIAIVPVAFGLSLSLWKLVLIPALGFLIGAALILVMPKTTTRWVPSPIEIEADRLILHSRGNPPLPFPAEVRFDRVTKVSMGGIVVPSVSWTPLPGEKRQGPHAGCVLTKENAGRVKAAWETWKLTGKR